MAGLYRPRVIAVEKCDEFARAVRTPLLREIVTPECGCRTSRISDPSVSATAAVPSVEPSSTMTISIGAID